jgi:hypothetical protein
MRIPVWVTIAAAVFVLGFGAFRIYLAVKKPDPEAQPKSGLHRMGRRMHALIGTVYILLGIALVATTLGWNPLGG